MMSTSTGLVFAAFCFLFLKAYPRNLDIGQHAKNTCNTLQPRLAARASAGYSTRVPQVRGGLLFWLVASSEAPVRHLSAITTSLSLYVKRIVDNYMYVKRITDNYYSVPGGSSAATLFTAVCVRFEHRLTVLVCRTRQQYALPLSCCAPVRWWRLRWRWTVLGLEV